MTIAQAIRILGIQLPTSPEGLKKAYREQAKLWHPDNFLLYEQQIEAGQRFIEAKQAYDILLSVDIDSLNRYKPELEEAVVRRHRHTEAPAYDRDLKIFHTPIFKEAQNIFSLFYLFSKWDWLGVPAFFNQSYQKVNEYIKPHKDGLGPAIARLFIFVMIVAGALLLAAVSLPLFAFAALLFIPLMWLYVKSVKGLTAVFKNMLGYQPAPNCRHLAGELAYLFIRTLFPIVIIVLGLYIITNYRITFAGWLLMSGYIFFIALITTSILYEWVSFIRVHYLKTKIKTEIN